MSLEDSFFLSLGVLLTSANLIAVWKWWHWYRRYKELLNVVCNGLENTGDLSVRLLSLAPFLVDIQNHFAKYGLPGIVRCPICERMFVETMGKKHLCDPYPYP